MTASDSLMSARRQLRSARVLELFGAEQGMDESGFRDYLLAALYEELASGESGNVEEDVIDTAVSVALARIDEDASEYLSALLVASQVLARNGELARLRQISPIFKDLARDLEEDRPYLGVTLRALSETLRGATDWALVDLNLALGFGESYDAPPRRVPRTWQHLADLLIATALRRWLLDGSVERLEQAREMAMEGGDGSLLTISELLLAFVESSNLAKLEDLVASFLPNFASQRFQRYLQARDVKNVFPAQRHAIESGVLSSASHLVAMPTSSGKTFLAELRIAAELTSNPGARVIYIAPYRLLSRQVSERLKAGLRHADISVGNLDEEIDVMAGGAPNDLPDVTIMTPERFDSILTLAESSRRGADIAAELLNTAVLVVLDEIQMVSRPGRGPRLEMILTRYREKYPHVHLLGLAAFGGDMERFASWLGGVPIIYRGGRPTGSIELVWRNDGSIYQRLGDRSSKVGFIARSKTAIDSAVQIATQVRLDFYPILIVETTRELAERVISKIANHSPRAGDRWRTSLTPAQQNELDLVAGSVQATLGEGHALARLIRQGLAYHHAGLPTHLLRSIENLVRSGAVRIVGATTTVAEGADLPFQVVIIPHLNFGGASKPLDRDLYHNIAGRVGRANVAIEGFVLTIAPSTESLARYPERVLWQRPQTQELASQLLNAFGPVRTLEDYRSKREVEGQILAWIGDRRSYGPNQSEALAAKTYCWSKMSTTEADRLMLVQGITNDLQQLEARALVQAASPYRLTPLGQRAVLARLSPASCLRLTHLLDEQWMEDVFAALRELPSISREGAAVVARVAYETEEVLEQGMWFQRERNRLKDGREAARLLQSLMSDQVDWPYQHDLFRTDQRMLAGWLLGEGYPALADLAPSFATGAFSSPDAGERALDAAEQMNRVSYAAAWAWSGVRALIGDQADDLPWWMRYAIEYGVPSESAVELIRRVRISRTSAVLLSRELSPRWETSLDLLTELGLRDLQAMDVPLADAQLLSQLHT